MNETQQILNDMVGRLLADHVTEALLAEAEKGHWPQALWRLVEDQGLTQPLVPVPRGGMGFSWHDAFENHPRVRPPLCTHAAARDDRRQLVVG